jgi:magnesium chelatase subunit I
MTHSNQTHSNQTHSNQDLPLTLGALRNSVWTEERIARRGVKDELRDNLICRLKKKERLFSGIVGYEDSVVPQMVNAILSRHNFILLGLRGQAKTRLIRMMTDLLDESTPYVAGCEIHDNPISRSAGGAANWWMSGAS